MLAILIGFDNHENQERSSISCFLIVITGRYLPSIEKIEIYEKAKAPFEKFAIQLRLGDKLIKVQS